MLFTSGKGNPLKRLPSVLFVAVAFLSAPAAAQTPAVYIRTNQIGYLPGDIKIAVAFSHHSAENESFEVIDVSTGKSVFGPAAMPANKGAYANFEFNHKLDFSWLKKEGRYKLRLAGSKIESLPFSVGPNVYNNHHEALLFFMREQRCGYNPFLDEVCHKKAGRTGYRPMSHSRYVEVSGG